jgi:hypothetical protein
MVKKGHDAMSCDLLPSETERPDGWDGHYQGDVLELLSDSSYHFDLMIAHPPCTYLCNSGVRWLSPGGVLNMERHNLMMKACDFFAELYWSKIPHIAVENPVMHKYARDYLMSTWKIPTFTQSIQPWQFGEGDTKRTCLWLRNLPPLKPSNIVDGRVGRIHLMGPGPNRARERSRTYQGIADAMAEQWG